ncbi:MAG: hypothetical protein ACJ8G7_03135 [Rhizobacter sp.]
MNTPTTRACGARLFAGPLLLAVLGFAACVAEPQAVTREPEAQPLQTEAVYLPLSYADEERAAPEAAAPATF